MNIAFATKTYGQPLLALSAAAILLASQSAGADNAMSNQMQDSKDRIAFSDFNEVDANNDNMVDWNELNQAYGDQLTEIDLNEEQLLGEFDLNQDNGLDQTEYHAFTSGVVERQAYSTEEIEQQPANNQQQTEQDQTATANEQPDGAPATENPQQNQSIQTGDDTVEAVVVVTEIHQVPVVDIMDREVVNLEDEKIGKVEDVVMSEDGSRTGLVVKTSGFLGLGGKEVVIDANEMHLTGERVVWERTADDKAVDQLPKYNEKEYVSLR